MERSLLKRSKIVTKFISSRRAFTVARCCSKMRTRKTMKNLVVKSDKDNVGNALEDILAGDEVQWEKEGLKGRLTALDNIPFGFKVALKDIARGMEVFCYGEVVGHTSQPVRAGECVHVHNVVGKRGNADNAGGRQ